MNTKLNSLPDSDPTQRDDWADHRGRGSDGAQQPDKATVKDASTNKDTSVSSDREDSGTEHQDL